MSKAEKKSREARGYGPAHRKLRERWAREVRRGGVSCARCGLPIEPGADFDLDHSDDRGGYLGVSHAHCNRRAGAVRRNGDAYAGHGAPFRSPDGRPWSRQW